MLDLPDIDSFAISLPECFGSKQASGARLRSLLRAVPSSQHGLGDEFLFVRCRQCRQHGAEVLKCALHISRAYFQLTEEVVQCAPGALLAEAARLLGPRVLQGSQERRAAVQLLHEPQAARRLAAVRSPTLQPVIGQVKRGGLFSGTGVSQSLKASTRGDFHACTHKHACTPWLSATANIPPRTLHQPSDRPR